MEVEINREIVEVLSSFKYLGNCFSPNRDVQDGGVGYDDGYDDEKQARRNEVFWSFCRVKQIDI